MPTYADEYNQHLLESGNTRQTNPVRLVISKGDYVFDPLTRKYRFEEKWEQQELMEYESFDTSSLVTQPPWPQPANNEIQRQVGHSNVFDSLKHPTVDGQSLWVLDTNTLLSCLDLLKALFSVCLGRNVSACRPSPICLVIPYMVISELDGLKLSSRAQSSSSLKPVSALAREANRWILVALQAQKRATVAVSDGRETPLPESMWALHVQSSLHFDSLLQDHRLNQKSNDEQIIAFCQLLIKQTGLAVWFCSDDTNARTRAEIDDILTIEMSELVKTMQRSLGTASPATTTEQRMMLTAEALVDQWEYQAHSVQQQPYQAYPFHSPSSLSAAADTALAPVATFASSAATTAATATPMTTRANAFSPDMDVEIDMEDPHSPVMLSNPTPTSSNVQELNPHIEFPSTLPAAASRSSRRNLSHSVPLSTAGRKTQDSIHSPQNLQLRVASSLTPPPLASTHPFSSSNLSSVYASETNPHIAWQDLFGGQRNGYSQPQ